jgi:hypothetical protein
MLFPHRRWFGEGFGEEVGRRPIFTGTLVLEAKASPHQASAVRDEGAEGSPPGGASSSIMVGSEPLREDNGS